MLRGRFIAALVVAGLVGALVMAPAAGAWTLPSNAGAAPGGSVASYCPSFPADAAQPSAIDVASGTVSTSLSGVSYQSVGTVARGSYTVVVGQSTTGTTYVFAQSQDSSGAWEYVGLAQTTANGDLTFQVPSGPLRIGFESNPSMSTTFAVFQVAEGSSDQALQQYADVACLDDAAAAGQAHSDSGAVLGELQTVDADLRASSTGAGGGVVELSPADRQLLADAANGAHDDLWLFGGAMLGIWLVSTVVRAVWL